MKTLSIDVSGMHCAGCASRLERSLLTVPGVEVANVNFALENAELTLRDGNQSAPATDRDTIIRAIAEAGFKAKPDTGDDTETAPTQSENLRSYGPLILSGILTLPMVIEMVLMPFAVGFHVPPTVQLAFATVVQFGVGSIFYKSAWASLRQGSATMDLLVVLGTSAAYFLSLFTLAANGFAPQGKVALYFEASCVIITLVLAGRVMEARAKKGATAAIRGLFALRPTTACLLSKNKEIEIPIGAVRIEDVIRVRPGELVPVDGIILDGESDFDESFLTGESQMRHRTIGQTVIGGTVNLTGSISIRTSAIGSDTRLSRIVDLVRSAQSEKAPIQRLVDRISAVFVPGIIGIAVITAIAWALTGAGAETSLIAAASVLVIACPCALGLAAPAAIAAGLGAAARGGILVRSMDALERARKADILVFDKTGTLTEGSPGLSEFHVIAGQDKNRTLALVAAAQRDSSHPLSQAFIQAAALKGIAADYPVADFRNIAGQGISATVDGDALLIGNERLMQSNDLLLPLGLTQTKDDAATRVWIAVNGNVQACAFLKDATRDEAFPAIQSLKDQGFETALLSGDNPGVVSRFGKALGINVAEASFQPEDKANWVKQRQAAGHSVAMVGDGINDAPALAQADLGIAMGSGAEVAMETAGVTLMRPDPRLVSSVLEIANRTTRTIRQNLFWAFAYNTVGIPLAALGYLSPALAGSAMALSSLCVVGNALLLTRWSPNLPILSSPEKAQ